MATYGLAGGLGRALSGVPAALTAGEELARRRQQEDIQRGWGQDVMGWRKEDRDTARMTEAARLGAMSLETPGALAPAPAASPYAMGAEQAPEEDAGPIEGWTGGYDDSGNAGLGQDTTEGEASKDALGASDVPRYSLPKGKPIEQGKDIRMAKPERPMAGSATGDYGMRQATSLRQQAAEISKAVEQHLAGMDPKSEQYRIERAAQIAQWKPIHNNLLAQAGQIESTARQVMTDRVMMSAGASLKSGQPKQAAAAFARLNADPALVNLIASLEAVPDPKRRGGWYYRAPGSSIPVDPDEFRALADGSISPKEREKTIIEMAKLGNAILRDQATNLSREKVANIGASARVRAAGMRGGGGSRAGSGTLNDYKFNAAVDKRILSKIKENPMLAIEYMNNPEARDKALEATRKEVAEEFGMGAENNRTFNPPRPVATPTIVGTANPASATISEDELFAELHKKK